MPITSKVHEKMQILSENRENALYSLKNHEKCKNFVKRLQKKNAHFAKRLQKKRENLSRNCKICANFVRSQKTCKFWQKYAENMQILAYNRRK